jgi:D-tyrosyl-tRNA(Tyr) deacylase
MRLLLQRVQRASVTVEGAVVGSIGAGLLVFVGLGQGDSEGQLAPALEKMLNLRIFADDAGQMNRSLVDVQGGLLLVSQFTLYADARKGRRPSYTGAMPPDAARALFDRFVAEARRTYSVGPVEAGLFGADMKVDLLNDGPVTIWLDSAEMSWGAKG